MRTKGTKKIGSGRSKTSKVREKQTAGKPKPIAKSTAKKSVTTVSSQPNKEARRSMVSKSSSQKDKNNSSPRQDKLHRILLAKRAAILREMQVQLGQSLNDEQQRRLESAMDSGDQALVDLEREMGISLQEMRNRERQLIDNALAKLEEGTYGVCAECGEEISEKRLEALPFATLCVACQSKQELLEKIERGEQRM